MNKDVIKDIKKDIRKKKKKKDIKKKLKIFEKNKWGFTLVELLGVIVILALVVGGGVFGIIKLIEKSRGESASISVESIKKAATVYSTEKDNDENYWKEMTISNYEGKYFCATVEELINKGLLPKDKDLGEVDIHTYVGIRKDLITLTKDNPVLLNNIKLEEIENLSNIEKLYGICTGNVINEKITNPVSIISQGNSFTDEINDITFSRLEGENIEIDRTECYYNNETSGNYNDTNKVVVDGTTNKCSLTGLTSNKLHYIRVCTYTKKNSSSCIDTSNTTKEIKKPTYILSDKLKITYNKDNIKGDSYYYFKSNKNATSNVNVSSCTLNNDNTFNCNNDNTININSNAWYKTTNKDIELTYNASGKVNIVARTYDKSNNYAESKKDFNVYKVIFNKGIADKIGDGISDITKICLADISGTCSIKSPTIEKLGYNVVGWNTNANATTSSWNANTNKNNVNGTYYPIVKAKTIKVIFYRNASTSDSTTATQTFTYGVSGQAFSAKGWTNTGHTMAGWAKNRNAVTKDYNTLSGVADTWINSYAPNINLYAVWNKDTYTIKYDANGGFGAPAEQKKTYGSNLTLSSIKPAKTGYVFNGWNTKKDGTGTNFAAGSNYTANGNATLYAMWNAKTVQVTFHRNTNSSDTVTATQTFTYGVSGQKFSDKNWSKSGYILAGWGIAQNTPVVTYSTLSGVSDAWIVSTPSNTHLYAVWQSTTFTLRYNDNGGRGCSTKTKTITNGSKLGTLCRPSRSGYWYFNGWYYDGTEYTRNTVFKGDSDITLTASWYYDEPEPEPEPEPDYPCVITGNPACRSCASTSCRDILGSYSMTGDGVSIGSRSGSWTYITDSSSGYSGCWVSDYGGSPPYSCSGSSGGGGGSSSGGSSSSKSSYCSLPSKREYIHGEYLGIGGMQLRNSSGNCESALLEKFRFCFTPTLQSRLYANSSSDKTVTINVSCSQIYRSFSFTVKVKCCNSLGEKACNSAQYCTWSAGFCRNK